MIRVNVLTMLTIFRYTHLLFANTNVVQHFVAMNNISNYFPSLHPVNITYAYKLCIVTRVKNVAHLLPQWFEYHILIGVDQFYIADDCSNDGNRTAFWMHFYGQLGKVSFFQNQTFNNCTHRTKSGQSVGSPALYDFTFTFAKPKCEWVGVIDPDEYLTARGDGVFGKTIFTSVNKDMLSVKPLLDTMRKPIIRLPWYAMSSHGYEKRPQKLLVDAYLMGKFHPQKNPIIKTMMKTKYVIKWNFSHYPTIFEPSAPNINHGPLRKYATRQTLASHEMVMQKLRNNVTCLVPRSPIFLKHFITLSWEDFYQGRGNLTFDSDGNKNMWARLPRSTWEEWNFTDTSKCASLANNFHHCVSRLIQSAAVQRLRSYRLDESKALRKRRYTIFSIVINAYEFSTSTTVCMFSFVAFVVHVCPT